MLVTGLLLLASCQEASVQLINIPENTPSGDQIFITGNFNNWDPGDETYRMELLDDGTYIVDLPIGFGKIEYKFTRGDWSTVEKDLCGYEVDNRVFHYGKQDIIYDTVMSWRDLDPVNCPQMTLVIKDLPENTPEDPKKTLAGNFNNWNADDEKYTFSYEESVKKYVLTLFKENLDKGVQYKVTRGSLSSEETDALGFEISPRSLVFGESDSVFLKIENWEDLGPSGTDFITYILDEIPANTPENDRIYYVGDINGWYPRDRSMILDKTPDGLYFIRFPIEKQGRHFKFTRGDWSTVEVDHFGDDIENRNSYFGEKDTIYLQIMNWKDLN